MYNACGAAKNNNFTYKTVTCHNIKTRAYTGSRFWVTHMNKKKLGEDTSKVTPPEVKCISSRLILVCIHGISAVPIKPVSFSFLARPIILSKKQGPGVNKTMIAA